MRKQVACLLLGAGVASAVGCSNRAVAIAECRELEAARCEAGAACGTIEDVEGCKRFYRDHCLHGIAGAEPPTSQEQHACVSAIEQAGACAEDDPEQRLASCGDAGLGGAGGASTPGSATVCDFVAAPWKWPVCDYLNPPPEGDGGEKG